MASWTLAAGSVLTFLAGVLYVAIGMRFARRAAEQGSMPMRTFSLFWFAIGYYGLTDGAWSLAVPLLDPPLAVGVTILVTKVLVGCVGFFGLVHGLAYVYTGRPGVMRPLAVFYALVYLLVLYSYVAADPIGQEAQRWRSGLVYADPGGLLDTLAVLALFLPPLFASLAYAGLYRRASTRAQRIRIATVSASLAVFFGSLILGWLGGGWQWWPLVEKLLAIATAAAVVLALRATPDERTGSETV